MHMTRSPSCAGTAAAHGAGARAQAAGLPEQGQAPRTDQVKSGSGRRAPAAEGNRPNAHSRGSHLRAGAGRRERQPCAGRRSQDCGAAPPRAAGGASGPRGGGSGCGRMAGPGARGRAGKSRPPAEARPRAAAPAAAALPRRSRAGDGRRLRRGAGRVVFVVGAALRVFLAGWAVGRWRGRPHWGRHSRWGAVWGRGAGIDREGCDGSLAAGGVCACCNALRFPGRMPSGSGRSAPGGGRQRMWARVGGR